MESTFIAYGLLAKVEVELPALSMFLLSLPEENKLIIPAKPDFVTFSLTVLLGAEMLHELFADFMFTFWGDCFAAIKYDVALAYAETEV